MLTKGWPTVYSSSDNETIDRSEQRQCPAERDRGLKSIILDDDDNLFKSQEPDDKKLKDSLTMSMEYSVTQYFTLLIN